MARKIFVNLPVKDLDRSKRFFETIGFSFDPQFSDDTALCMVIDEGIYAMLLTEARFGGFSKKKIADATETTEVLVAVSLDSREEVDRTVDAALGAGATVAYDPMDQGFMFVRSFNDPDGHIWEIFWMDESQVPQQAAS